MSDGESSLNSGEAEYETQYACRHCPNELFTADELEAHRALHRKSKQKRQRDASPNRSELTLFQEVDREPPAKRNKKDKPRKKRESIKHYNKNAVKIKGKSG